ncbi:sensor histidine kinase [Hamadaea tsunoensis]|uniref:sensor histidine kinase n=1 Tax=Hamadaea tsunoensis TaxID=53368 RepID=UPI00041315C0|nr:sensor histidine kinase [Hamadaea tsunoensis]
MTARTLLRRAEHVLFAVLLVVGAVSASAYVLPAVVGAWYAVGILLARPSGVPDVTRSRALPGLWLGALVAGWVGLTAVSASFVWLAFPLMLLGLHLLRPVPGHLLVVALVLASAAAFTAHQGTFDPGALLGPVIGAGVAIVMNQVYGWLRREADLLRELADARERLAATERRAGVLAERERLAREIHDTVAQDLSSILLHLRAAPPAVGAAERTAMTALESARRLVRELTPAELSGGSLPDALARLAADLRPFGVATALVVDGEPAPLPTPVSVALLRVAQSALANVRTHSAARQAVVTLSFQNSAVRLDVADDGVGFDAERVPAGGLGLPAMRKRVAEAGGVFVVEAAPGGGTAVSATVPL